MKWKRRLWLATLVLAVVLGAWMALVAAMVISTIDDTHRNPFLDLALSRWPLMVLGWAAGVLGSFAFLRWASQRWLRLPTRMAERVWALVTDAEGSLRLPVTPGRDDEELATAINELAAQREDGRKQLIARVAEASQRLQTERNRLAALLGELTEAVIVCTADGRVALYNRRARLQCRALSDQPDVAGGADLLGIGRSIFAVFDRELIAHALERIGQRLDRGASRPTAQFVTSSKAGQLLRVQVAPVLADDGGGDTPVSRLQGYVLLLENVTRAHLESAEREAAFNAFATRANASLARVRESLAVGADSAQQSLDDLASAIREWAEEGGRQLRQRWPLEEVLAADFLRAAARRIATVSGREPDLQTPDDPLWLRLDSFSLIQGLSYLAQRLVDEYQVRYLRLRVQAAQGLVHLDLVWAGQALNTETAMTWGSEPITEGGAATALTLRDIVDRHGAQWWFERDRLNNEGFFRFVLPVVPALDSELAAGEASEGLSRPEYFDFDLFAARETTAALHDRSLASLVYCVFDTETTGLKPSEGDEIIQLGAVRVFNGRVLRQESFEQLVDPGRPIPPATIPIHGITPDMVAGRPRIEAVLPAFHRFAQDTVLVAHNAAFDMKFLQLLESRTGLRFEQPVLDTLLLSAVVNPLQDSHRLEALAERFSIPVLGRHTAQGDALVTAEVLVRLIPMLQAQGIHTLGQALEASRKTYLARLKY
jgi:DNA polymerase-3 subunit epsilon